MSGIALDRTKALSGHKEIDLTEKRKAKGERERDITVGYRRTEKNK
jgi:hypothetical protein